jgi:hypothetical protein
MTGLPKWSQRWRDRAAGFGPAPRAIRARAQVLRKELEAIVKGAIEVMALSKS